MQIRKRYSKRIQKASIFADLMDESLNLRLFFNRVI